MSYFHDTRVRNLKGSTERKLKKHNKRRSIDNENVTESVESSHNRRRHSSWNSSRIRADDIDSACENSKLSTVRRKGRRLLHNKIVRLMDENHSFTTKIEDNELLNDSKKEDKSIMKIRDKYQKWKQKFCELRAEYDKLKNLLTERDEEYKELHAQHEKLISVINSIEENRIKLINETEKNKAENIQLREDVSLLKNLVYRLNVELEKYQDKLLSAGQNLESQNVKNIVNQRDFDIDNDKVIKSWENVNTHALGPLLNAYQENIDEKHELIKKYEQELDVFSGKCKEIVAENERLYKEIEKLTTKCERYAADMKILEDDAAIIKEQNDLLTKQNNFQKQKLQEINSIYEHKVESMSQDNNTLHKDYLACKTELCNLQGKYEILNEGYEKLKSNSERTMPVSVHNNTVEECKRLFEELKNQYENDKKKLNAKIKQLEETQPENEKQLIVITAERDQLRSQVRILEKNLKQRQHKLDHIQKNVCSIRISRESFKRQLNKITIYCKELVAERELLLNEREKLMVHLKVKEKETKDITLFGNNIAHRMGDLKNQLKSVQKGAEEQLATVEKHIRNQELGADQMKAEFSREVQRLKNLVREKEEIIGKLQREKRLTRDNLEFVIKAATNDSKKIEKALKCSSKIHNF